VGSDRCSGSKFVLARGRLRPGHRQAAYRCGPPINIKTLNVVGWPAAPEGLRFGPGDPLSTNWGGDPMHGGQCPRGGGPRGGDGVPSGRPARLDGWGTPFATVCGRGRAGGTCQGGGFYYPRLGTLQAARVGRGGGPGGDGPRGPRTTPRGGRRLYVGFTASGGRRAAGFNLQRRFPRKARPFQPWARFRAPGLPCVL